VTRAETAEKAWDQRLQTAQNVRTLEIVLSPFLIVWLLVDLFEYFFLPEEIPE